MGISLDLYDFSRYFINDVIRDALWRHPDNITNVLHLKSMVLGGCKEYGSSPSFEDRTYLPYTKNVCPYLQLHVGRHITGALPLNYVAFTVYDVLFLFIAVVFTNTLIIYHCSTKFCLSIFTFVLLHLSCTDQFYIEPIP